MPVLGLVALAAYVASLAEFEKSPHDLHRTLKPNIEYKTRFGDLVHRFFYNDGPMAGMGPRARVNSRASGGESSDASMSVYLASRMTPKYPRLRWMMSYS